MHGLRAYVFRRRRLAALVLALAVLMKALVPAGYMPALHGKVLTVSICTDASGRAMTRHIVLPADGKLAADAGGEHGKSQGTCPYAGLGMAGLAGGDAALLALAIAFVLALGFAPVRTPLPARTIRLRPPLRGPPALLTA
jgi:hypothetical protein